LIRSWKNSTSERVYRGERVRAFASLDYAKARLRLRALDAAVTLEGLGQLRSVGLHKLKGRRREQWAVSVNGPWRICFVFRDGDAYDVEIVDYHKG
jgi:toxin HigB-1